MKYYKKIDKIIKELYFDIICLRKSTEFSEGGFLYIMIWHSEKKETVAMELQSPPKKGLTEMIVGLRLEEYGKNTITERKKKSNFRVFMSKLFAPVSLILILFSVVSTAMALTYEKIEVYNLIYSAVILLAVILWASVSAKRERTADTTIVKMKKITSASARVRRNKIIKEIPAASLVPGDIVQLEAGDIIPADGRLLITTSFICDESAITGDDTPVIKDSDVVLYEDTPLEKRVNMVYSGTIAIAGRALMMVTETGADTQIGLKYGSNVRKVNNRTQIVKNAHKISSSVSWFVLFVCLAIFAVVIFNMNIESLPQNLNEVKNILMRREIYNYALFAITLAVCATPFGLPQSVLYSLTEGVKHLSGSGAMLRKFKKTEIIGCTSIICTDKTGTLTLNKMSVAKAWPIGDIPSSVDEGFWSDEMKYLMQCSALCCDCKVTSDENGEEKITGDPTEVAIISAYLRDGNDIDKVMRDYPRVAEIPFDSNRKLMSVIHDVNGVYMVITKGAPDVLMSKCIGMDAAEINRRNSEFCGEGLRVIAVAVNMLNQLPDKIMPETVENELTFIGLIGMLDPHREDVEEAVNACSTAGIRTVMITGDHPETASAIACKLGIMREGEKAITGEELEKMSDEKLASSIEKYSVFARITSDDKVRLIKMWQSKGNCVLMTAGGLGDAPALHSSDISCSVEATATDVAAEAADISLSENNFVNISSLIKQGRLIRKNITKLTEYCATCSVAEVVLLVLGKFILGTSILNLLPIMILNLLVFQFIQPAFANEPAEKDIMDVTPELNNGKLWSFFEKLRSVISGLYIGLTSLLAYAVGAGIFNINPTFGEEQGVTMAFAAVSGGIIMHSICMHSGKPMVISGVFRNGKLIRNAIIVLIIAVIMITVPYVNTLFGLVSLSSRQWCEIGILLVIQFVAWEYSKLNAYVR